jgi:hypothetical protein
LSLIPQLGLEVPQCHIDLFLYVDGGNGDDVYFKDLRTPLQCYSHYLSGAYSDPRDKVFAIMSVADSQDIVDLEVSFDYTLILRYFQEVYYL